MKTYNTRPLKSSKKRPILLIVGLVILVMALIVGVWAITSNRQIEEVPQPAPQTSQDQPEPEPEPKPAPINLQPTIDNWVAKQPATYGIVVYDPAAKQTIGSNLAEQEFFAASLYKLFVAYLALIDFQNGTQNPDQKILGSQTRRQCVDKMIRSSDSPCGEAMMSDMTRPDIQRRLQSMDIHNTDFNNLTTTPEDAAKILSYIVEQAHLNDSNTEFLRGAMHDQPQMYRLGLARGAPKATWYTKVGWNEQFNYHDIGIMKLPDGQEYVVAILSQGNGRSAPISDFAATIYSALTR